MTETNPRPHIIVGHFGSGKTEIALQEALSLAAWDGVIGTLPMLESLESLGKTAEVLQPRAVLVDLDIVNPMFRSTRAAKLLAAQGIRLIHSPFALSGLDSPSVVPQVQGVFTLPYPVIFDIGGDDIGAIAMGQFAMQSKKSGYVCSYVINARRPFSDTGDQVLAMLDKIQTASRLQVTELYNNTHLMEYTTLQELLDGQAVCEAVGAELQLPVTRVYATSQALLDEASMHPAFANFVRDGGQFVRIQRLLQLPWSI